MFAWVWRRGGLGRRVHDGLFAVFVVPACLFVTVCMGHALVRKGGGAPWGLTVMTLCWPIAPCFRSAGEPSCGLAMHIMFAMRVHSPRAFWFISCHLRSLVVPAPQAKAAKKARDARRARGEEVSESEEEED